MHMHMHVHTTHTQPARQSHRDNLQNTGEYQSLTLAVLGSRDKLNEGKELLSGVLVLVALA